MIAFNKLLLPFYLATLLLFGMQSPLLADEAIDGELRDLLKHHNISGETFFEQELPDIQGPLPQLGKLLFFTKALSGDNDTACASCHHPLLGGGDDLSLSVGVGAVHADLLGVERRHNGDNTVDPEADGGPNVPRNAQTTYNIAFWNRGMFHDGRVFVGDDEVVAQGQGQQIHTPDSILGMPDPNAGANIVEAQARFPVTATTEMRGFRFGNESAQSIREFLAQKLATQFRRGFAVQSPWLPLFQKAFNVPQGTVQELITYDNIATALSEYQRSQVFVNSPWLEYVKGNDESISIAAKHGALLFFETRERRGAGCASCHYGDFFSDQNYHNLAVPQFGRGRATADNDFGRYAVTRNEVDRFKFRTPTLLNVTETAPYGHSGAFQSLKEVIFHHLNPELSISRFDFSLEHLPQFSTMKVEYERAVVNTLSAFRAMEKTNDPRTQPANFSDAQLDQIVTFLGTLTDPCTQSSSCLLAWIPDFTDPLENPDGLGLRSVFKLDDVKDLGLLSLNLGAAVAGNPIDVPVIPGAISGLNANTNGTPDFSRKNCPVAERTPRKARFVDVTADSGISHSRQVPEKGRLGDSTDVLFSMYDALYGSVASADYDGDCFPDLLFENGADGAGSLYHNNAGAKFELVSQFDSTRKEIGEIVTPVFVDLNADGWLDIFSGNIQESSPKILFNDGQGGFKKSVVHSSMRVYRGTAGVSLADIDNDGDLDLALGHWSYGTGAEDEHLWENRGNGHFAPAARKFSIYGEFDHTDYSLTPRFADINNDGFQDLLFANDFQQSLLFINNKGVSYTNATNPAVLSDENAMGSAIADFNNDGYLDWFVTSITATAHMPGAFGLTGNRMYFNSGDPDNTSVFVDATDATGVRAGHWAWGACAADFNNDGNIDLFHTTGPMIAREEITKSMSEKHFLQFLDTPSKLYLSNGDGTFTDKASELGIEHRESGRGIACVDYDRDGDVDIVIANNSGAPRIYRNDIHNGYHSITIKLIGHGENIEAVGARVYVTSGETTQMQEMAIKNHYMSQSPTEVHFGLGAAAKIDTLKVSWPNGSETMLSDVSAGQYLYVEQPELVLDQSAQ